MESKAQIMIIPFIVPGRTNPMLQFSKRLVSKGLKVTIITTTTMSESMKDQTPTPTTTTSSTTSSGGSIKIEPIFFDAGEEKLTIAGYVNKYMEVVEQNLPRLIEKHNNEDDCCPVKVIVYDSLMPGLLNIAHQLGLKGAVFFTQSCAVSAIYYHVSEGLLITTPFQESQVCLPGLPILDAEDLPSILFEADPSSARLVADQYSNFQDVDWVFINTFDMLEIEVINWMSSIRPIKAIGPTIPSMYLDKHPGMENDKDYGLNPYNPNSETCIKWLDEKENGSVLYASLGSISAFGEDQMEEMAWGLANSNTYFLWVVRASEESKLPKYFKEKALEKGLIVNWCPQLQVLAHKAVGCFMTHCGWNSTIEALSLGVPMLAIPIWTDQTTNAKFIADVWQAGVRVRKNEKGIFTREEIENQIREVMVEDKGAELKKNAVRWKELAIEAVSEGGSTDLHVEEFATKAKLL